jgi:hypothetical protein
LNWHAFISIAQPPGPARCVPSCPEGNTYET